MKQVITAQLTDAEVMAAVAQALFKSRGIKHVGPAAISVSSIKCIGGNIHNVVLEFDAPAGRFNITFDPGEN